MVVSPATDSTLRPLGLPPTCVDVAVGRNPLPVVGVTQPAPWYGYPPALIPFWSEGFVYTGLWHHWFTPRPPAFVRMYVRAGHSLTEVARTPEQFVAFATVLAIVAHDELRPDTVAFARRAGVRDLDAIDRVTLATGDEPRGLVALQEFQRETPLAVVGDGEYDGWFPTPLRPGPRAWWETASRLELDDATRDTMERSPAMPMWLTRSDLPAVFETAIAAGDLRAAWLALNGPGWVLADATSALMRLDAAANRPAFSTYCAAWIAAAAGQIGGW